MSFVNLLLAQVWDEVCLLLESPTKIGCPDGYPVIQAQGIDILIMPDSVRIITLNKTEIFSTSDPNLFQKINERVRQITNGLGYSIGFSPRDQESPRAYNPM